jgi:hypothetical protein
MLLKVSPGGPPAGNYTTTFAGVESITNEKFGAGLRWKFRITQGPQTGQVAFRTTGVVPTGRNGCGKVLAGLLGRETKVDEEVDVQHFVGRAYLIVVAAAESGGTRVETIVPIATAS